MPMDGLKKRLNYHIYVIAVLTAFTLSLVFAGVTLFVLNAGHAIDATSVGHIYLGDHDDDELAAVLGQEIPGWKNEADFLLRFQDQELEIDLSLFAFDVVSTVSHLHRDVNNEAYFTLSESDEDEFLADLETVFTTEIINHFHLDAFLVDLMNDLKNLRQTVIYDVEDYLEESLSANVIHTTTITDLNEADADAIVSSASLLSIPALNRFSILDLFGETDLTNEQMSIIASGIEAITLATSFSGFIFEPYPDLPTWGRYGANVRILRVSGYDFSFYNDLGYGFEIQIEKTAPTILTFRLLGYPFLTDYQGTIVQATVIPFDIVFVADDSLTAATPDVQIIDNPDDTTYRLLVQTGSDGAIYFGIRTVTPPGGIPVEVRIFAEQYLPANETYRENIVPKEGD